MRKRHGLHPDNRGMTMVEVLMGFVLLILILGMLSGSIAAANNIYFSAVDLQREGELVQQEVYKKNLTSGLTPQADATLIPATGMPAATTDIVLSAKLYQVSVETEPAGTEESPEVSVFVLK